MTRKHSFERYTAHPTWYTTKATALVRLAATLGTFSCTTVYEGACEVPDLDLYRVLDALVEAGEIVKAPDHVTLTHDTMTYLPGPNLRPVVGGVQLARELLGKAAPVAVKAVDMLDEDLDDGPLVFVGSIEDYSDEHMLGERWV